MFLQEVNNGGFNLLRIRSAEEMEASIHRHQLSVLGIDEELDFFFRIGD